MTELEITASADTLDKDGFGTLWAIAASSVDGDTDQARHLACQLLLFLCKHRFAFGTASNTDVQYLDEWFERDNKLLYSWTPESEMVDVVAQHFSVPFDTFRTFLETKKFKIDKKYTAKRSLRVEWFQEDWNVG